MSDVLIQTLAVSGAWRRALLKWVFVVCHGWCYGAEGHGASRLASLLLLLARRLCCVRGEPLADRDLMRAGTRRSLPYPPTPPPTTARAYSAQ